MPVYTPYYNMAAFLNGEVYSSVLDKERMSTIDTQLAFVSNIIGDGRISGWTVTDATVVAPDFLIDIDWGTGIINNFVTQNSSVFVGDVPASSVNYVYMQRKPYLSKLFGPFSDIGTLAWTDTTPPIDPAGPVNLVFSDITHESLVLSWDANSEADLSDYMVERCTDGITYVQIARTTDPSYSDTGLLDNTTYFYRVYAFDKSGNISIPSIPVFTTTLRNLTAAAKATYFLPFPSDGQVSLVWGEVNDTLLDHFTIVVQELDAEYNSIGLSTSYTVDENLNFFIVDELLNDHTYRFTIYSVNQYDVLSEPLSVNATPKLNIGPAEATDLELSYGQSVSNPKFIKLDFSWEDGIEAYRALAERYLITVIENGSVVSNPITVIYGINDLVIEEFLVGNICTYVKPQTDYILKIQAIDENGNTNNGSVIRIFTGIVVAPSAPHSITSELTENGLLFLWKNTSSSFEYNTVTLDDEDLSTFVTTTQINEFNNGRAKSYVYPFASLLPDHKYTIKLKAVDAYGNESEESIHEHTILPLDYTTSGGSSPSSSRPPAINKLFAFGGDRSILLIWSEVINYTPDFYRIWRTPYRVAPPYDPADFTLVSTVPGTVFSYVDYGLTNDTRYIYMITTVDMFGNESLNPIDDEYTYHTSFHALPVDGGSNVTHPIAVWPVPAGGYDITISWNSVVDGVEGDFDCYEIYFSPLNLYSWEKVGSVDNDTTVFIHQNALIHGDGNYNYIVRAARDETRVLVSQSSTPPINSIELAKITTTATDITIEDTARDLGGLEDFIGERIEALLDDHKHVWTPSYDRRIDLNSNVIITDWVTNDQKTYATADFIVGTFMDGNVITVLEPLFYVVKVDDAITDIPFVVDPLLKRIRFSSATGSDDISVECVGINETSGILPDERMGTLSATVSGSGRVNEAVLPDIPHTGRNKENLLPLQLPMTSDNGYTYKIYQNENSDVHQDIGGSTSFYDFIRASDGSLIAATSRGILISDNEGSTWSVLYETYAPPHTFYKATEAGRFLAIANGAVYISTDGLGWASTSGLSNTAIVRDAIEDGVSIYVSTDLGVYILEEDSLGDLLVWQQTSLYSGKSTDTYAMYYDSVEDRVVVSSEIGLFETFDGGVTWSYTDELEEMTPVWRFLQQNNYVFAITNDNVWRKHQTSSQFTEIASIDADVVRDAVIFLNRFVIATDEGAMASSETANIFNDTGISFVTDIFHSIKFPLKITPISLLSVTNSLLYLGTDQNLFYTSDLDIFHRRYRETTGIIPTVYVDEIEQIIGYYYSTDNDLVYFDRKMEETSTITVANQYSNFRAENEGWIDEYYNSNVDIFDVTGSIVTLVNGSVPLGPLELVEFDIFSPETSNADIANEFIDEYDALLLHLRNVVGGAESLATGETLRSIVYDLVDLYYKVYSQHFGEIRYGSLVTIDGNDYIIFGNQMILSANASALLANYVMVENIPEFNFSSVLNSNINANASDGVLSINNSTYNKYDPLFMSASDTAVYNIGSNTHKQLEDALDAFNSGLTLSLADADHVNTLKTGLYIEKTFDGASEDDDFVFNSQYVIPRNKTWYDVLNSTVDYTEEVACANSDGYVGYPTAVLYVESSNDVFVGDYRGLMRIDVDTFEMAVVTFNDTGNEEYVRDLLLQDGTIYLLTDHFLYTSVDFGYTWSIGDTLGLSGDYRKIFHYNSHFVLATTDGIYRKYETIERWEQVADVGNVRQFSEANGIIALTENNKIYYSVNGADWTDRGKFEDIDVSQVGLLNTIVVLATDSGLRHDSGTIYGLELASTLIDLEGNTEISAALKINDLSVDNIRNEIVSGSGDGEYYIWQSDANTVLSDSSGMDAIHRVLSVGNDYWLFGNGMVRALSQPYPITIGIGIPF